MSEYQHIAHGFGPIYDDNSKNLILGIWADAIKKVEW